MKKYSDIKNIYDICECTKDYIKVKIDGKSNYLYLYEVDPVIVINKNDKYIKDILGKYEEFLRSLNLEFQIIIDKSNVDIMEVLDNDLNDEDVIKNMLKKENHKNILGMIENSTVIMNKYYIIIKSSNKVNDMSIYMNILKNLGLNVSNIDTESKIQKFIMKGVAII